MPVTLAVDGFLIKASSGVTWPLSQAREARLGPALPSPTRVVLRLAALGCSLRGVKSEETGPGQTSGSLSLYLSLS